jgi:uncharacterized repeat protein (TIGR03847 family)
VSERIDLDPVTRITAAATGEPGHRTFYLQARDDAVVVSLLVEKQQVALLALHVDELLERIGRAPNPEDAGVPDPSSLDLEEPVDPAFRVGQIGLGYEEDRDLVLLQCDEYVPEDADEEQAPADPGRVRIWATRGQVYALARRGEREVAAGRPTCPMCGEPLDPAGHFCPRSNGHRAIPELSE